MNLSRKRRYDLLEAAVNLLKAADALERVSGWEDTIDTIETLAAQIERQASQPASEENGYYCGPCDETYIEPCTIHGRV